MVLVPMDTPGLTVVRSLSFCGHSGIPSPPPSFLSNNVPIFQRKAKVDTLKFGSVVRRMHAYYQPVTCQCRFDNVRVPLGNILLGEGRGFEIAQGRLGPGRVHHCMRLIGLGSRTLNLMVLRASARSAFGKKLSSNECVLRDIAESRLKVQNHQHCDDDVLL